MFNLWTLLKELKEDLGAASARPKDYRVLEVVEAERTRLDAIFGKGAYVLIDRPEAAEVRCKNQRFVVWRDLTFALYADIEVGELTNEDDSSSLDEWLGYLEPQTGQREPRFDKHGWCTTPPSEMVSQHLDKLERLQRELFSSQERTLEALRFIHARSQAYADSASVKR